MKPSKTQLDELVKGHNGQDDQTWHRTLATKYPRSGGIEVIGLDSYRNLYFVQISDDERVMIDWISKTEIGEQQTEAMPEHFRVSDSVLDKFRQKMKWIL